MTDLYQNPILDEFGNPVLMEGFKNVWQMLGSSSSNQGAMTMDLTSMLLFMMIPIISPLNATIVNVILSFVGGILFSIGLCVISNQILKKN